MAILITDFTLDEGCDGTGIIECHCAGDFCVCLIQGAALCPGCPDCMEPEPMELDAAA